jgi:hypothetical protein
MGCNAVVTGPEYTDFILEVDVFSGDNDGVGFVFGWKSAEDHHVVLLENDQWPIWAMDGVSGPFLKFKRRIPGKPCAHRMNETTSCFNTYAYFVVKFISHAYAKLLVCITTLASRVCAAGSRARTVEITVQFDFVHTRTSEY